MSDSSDDKLRRRIAAAAARGVSRGSDATRAVFRAARRVAGGWVPEDGLPTAAEVHDEVARTLDPATTAARITGDRFDQIAAVVGVLATVRQDPVKHPEGDVLEHSLQVFDRVHAERPYDEELLTAALVHDVGRAIDRADPVAAGLEAVAGLVTPRTAWLVETLPVATAYRERTLGQRARQRLEAHPDFLDVLLLAEADRGGRGSSHTPLSLDQAVAVLRALDLAAAEEDEGGGTSLPPGRASNRR